MQRVGSAPAKLMRAPFKKFSKAVLAALKKTEGQPYVRGSRLSLSKSHVPGELKPSVRAWMNSAASKVPHKKGSKVSIHLNNIFTRHGTNQHKYKFGQTYSKVNHASVRRLRRAVTGKSEKTNISPKTMKKMQDLFKMK